MTSSNVDLMHKIAALQLFDGSYNLDNTLSSTLNINLLAVQQEAKSKGWDMKGYAITLVLAFFREKLGSLQDDWELIADKSRIWLLGNSPQHADDMFDSALKFINN